MDYSRANEFGQGGEGEIEIKKDLAVVAKTRSGEGEAKID